jgi:hypothetical protein
MSALRTFTWAGIIATGITNLHGSVATSGRLLDSISGTKNNYAPTGIDSATILALNGTGTITGIVAQPLGTLKIIYFQGTITLSNNGSGSDPANRIRWNGGTSITFASGDVAFIWYLSSNWSLVTNNRNLT